MSKRTWMALVASGVVLAGLLARARGDDPPKPQEKLADAPKAAQKKGERKFPDLVAGLKATPGCLGVETAQTSSGMQVIFAWFKDKKAALAWYDSDMHQMVMHSFANGPGDHEPLADIPDDGPIMAIASLTPSDKPKYKQIHLPVSQISIELYRPLNGGIFLGGRFAPEALEVPRMKDVTPKK